MYEHAQSRSFTRYRESPVEELVLLMVVDSMVWLGAGSTNQEGEWAETVIFHVKKHVEETSCSILSAQLPQESVLGEQHSGVRAATNGVERGMAEQL